MLIKYGQLRKNSNFLKVDYYALFCYNAQIGERMKKLFIFDIDDVIYDLKSMMYEALKEHTGKDIHHDTWKTLNMFQGLNLNINKSTFGCFF